MEPDNREILDLEAAYLLGNVTINRPNQVWAADITYLPMAHGFLYLMAILDVARRKVLEGPFLRWRRR